MGVEEVASIENFFFYGQGNIEQEIKHDILVGVTNPKRTMFYDREYGTDIDSYENKPISATMEVGIAFSVVEFMARRNNRVSDGSNGTRDRRVASSQSVIEISSKNRNDIDVEIRYIPFNDYEKIDSVSILGG